VQLRRLQPQLRAARSTASSHSDCRPADYGLTGDYKAFMAVSVPAPCPNASKAAFAREPDRAVPRQVPGTPLRPMATSTVRTPDQDLVVDVDDETIRPLVGDLQIVSPVLAEV
jgi:hypothetical protein